MRSMGDRALPAAHLATRAQPERPAGRLGKRAVLKPMQESVSNDDDGRTETAAPLAGVFVVGRAGLRGGCRRAQGARRCSWVSIPSFARLFAISLAMLVGWLAHRTFTFALRAPPSLAEFLRYAAVGWRSPPSTTGLFVLMLVLWPPSEPLAALLVSSLAATLFAYLGMRYAAFRVHLR